VAGFKCKGMNSVGKVRYSFEERRRNECFPSFDCACYASSAQELGCSVVKVQHFLNVVFAITRNNPVQSSWIPTPLCSLTGPHTLRSWDRQAVRAIPSSGTNGGRIGLQSSQAGWTVLLRSVNDQAGRTVPLRYASPSASLRGRKRGDYVLAADSIQAGRTVLARPIPPYIRLCWRGRVILCGSGIIFPQGSGIIFPQP
jgi:hypothetical protein